MSGRRGQMLLIVLWVLGLLTVALGALAMHSAHESRLSRIPLDLIEREGLAHAGVFRALSVLAEDDPAADHFGEAWATGRIDDATWSEAVPLEQGAFSVGRDVDGAFEPGVIDEASKLNLRTAAPHHVHALFQRVLPAEADSASLAVALQDWQDEPEGETCQSVVCHNAPLQSVEELLAVPGMTPALVEALRPYVTVYTNGSVNVNTASVEVLDALGCPGDELAQQRAQQPFTSTPPSCPGTGVASSVFLIQVSAELAHRSGQASLSAVARRDGTMLSWRPSGDGH